MVKNSQLKPIRYGRKIGWKEGNRIWSQCVNHSAGGEYVRGVFVSPHGSLWRPCGAYYPGLLLVNWTTGKRYTVDYRTLLWMQAHGWKWVPDSREQLKFSIHRWADGTHYYVIDSQGDPVTFKGQEKYDTWDKAWRAGTRWSMTS